VERENDLAVGAVAQIVRHPPDVDGPGEPDDPNMNARGVRLPGVATPVAPVAEDGQPVYVDVDAFWHIKVDVPERRQHGDRRLLPIHGGVAEIEVEIPADAGGHRRPAQPEPPAPHHATPQGGAETGRPTA
jgi:hypothetical protein